MTSWRHATGRDRAFAPSGREPEGSDDDGREACSGLTSAAAEGVGYRGLVHAPWGEQALAVLERDADTEAALLEYLVLATTRLSTRERELAEAASLGYRVMGITMDGGGTLDVNDRLAFLARPRPGHAPEATTAVP